MTYSIDLRERVVGYIRSGGRKTEAAKLFGVGRNTIYLWLNSPNLSPKSYTRNKFRKLDWGALRRHVMEHPAMLSKERAVHFGVSPPSVCYALKKMNLTRKKSN